MIPVLHFHFVGDPGPGAAPGLSVTRERFASYMQWLFKRGYTVTGVCELAANRDRLACPRIAITFDDGYADLRQYALPLLAELGFSATIFMPAGLIGRSNRWDEAIGCRPLPLFSASDLEWCIARGFSIGAHGFWHRDLTALSEQELRQEVIGSRRLLEVVTGQPVKTFCYPFGRYDGRVVRVVSSSFSAAFSTRPGLADLRTEPWALRRLQVPPRMLVSEFGSFVRRGGLPLSLRLRSHIARMRTRALLHAQP